MSASEVWSATVPVLRALIPTLSAAKELATADELATLAELESLLERALHSVRQRKVLEAESRESAIRLQSACRPVLPR